MMLILRPKLSQLTRIKSVEEHQEECYAILPVNKNLQLGFMQSHLKILYTGLDECMRITRKHRDLKPKLSVINSFFLIE